MEVFQPFHDKGSRNLAWTLMLAKSGFAYDPTANANMGGIVVPGNYTPPSASVAGSTPPAAPTVPGTLLPFLRYSGHQDSVLMGYLPSVPSPPPGDDWITTVTDLTSGEVIQGPKFIEEAGGGYCTAFRRR